MLQQTHDGEAGRECEEVGTIIYLSSFLFSERSVIDPNIYPYNVFAPKTERRMFFGPVTVLYGNNASGKSTVLNIIANKLQLKGQEYAACNRYGRVFYFERFVEECRFTLGEREDGRPFREIPGSSRYIKSEDILYEIKKIQQEQVLQDGYVYEHVRRGRSKEAVRESLDSYGTWQLLENLKYAQEKYSNGETTLQLLEDYIEPDGLYLLDEPEVSLSPENQTILAEKLNRMARFLGCQFIVSTHSPFMLGTLQGRIYNLDSKDWEEAEWTELENVQYFYRFFEKHRKEFEG